MALKDMVWQLLESERNAIIDALDAKLVSHARALNKAGLHPAVAVGLQAAVDELELLKSKVKQAPTAIAP